MKYLLWIVIAIIIALAVMIETVHAYYQTKEELKDCSIIANTFIDEVGIAKALK